jgi:hypothetical protein
VPRPDGIPSSRRTEACLSARRTRTAIGRGTTTGSLLRSLRPASQPRTVRSETSKTRANSAPDRPKGETEMCATEMRVRPTELRLPEAAPSFKSVA